MYVTTFCSVQNFFNTSLLTKIYGYRLTNVSIIPNLLVQLHIMLWIIFVGVVCIPISYHFVQKCGPLKALSKGKLNCCVKCAEGHSVIIAAWNMN